MIAMNRPRCFLLQLLHEDRRQIPFALVHRRKYFRAVKQITFEWSFKRFEGLCSPTLVIFIFLRQRELEMWPVILAWVIQYCYNLARHDITSNICQI